MCIRDRAELRYKLVPDRVSDEKFWRNYFFRIKLIKDMPSLLDKSGDTPSQPTPTSALAPVPAAPAPDESRGDSEFVSDDYTSTECETDAWRKELQEELGLGEEEEEEDDGIDVDWEADLTAELEELQGQDE
eukprot:TRINITY_DN27405_c0_g1_i1.p1 TRINITY_DN27405_c0_g1~~TRINITY_DN27405_c0_g1_i1.p1  ORF type:complete len:132 (-),score=48.70 TRINITY_DN27405_c0_g1_i1:42-437(-)